MKPTKSGTESIISENAGIVSYKVDGLENVLTPNDLAILIVNY